MIFEGRQTELDYPEQTMFQMVEGISKLYPEEPALELYGKKTSYRQLIARIEEAAGALMAAGIGEGDAVTICMPNIPQAVVCFYALDRIGAVANMVHPLSAQNEITFYLDISHSSLILTVDMFYKKVDEACDQADHPVRILTARIQDELPLFLKIPYMLKAGRKSLKYPDSSRGILWTRFLKGASEAGKLPEISFDPKRTSVILYSGGTSGTPKGICLSDLNMNALAMQCRNAIPCSFQAGLKMLSCMPMFHGFGLGVNIHTVLIHGVECLLMPTFNNQSYADALIKKKPNFIAGVPAIYEALLHMPQLRDARLDHLMGIFCGGDSLSVELKHKVDTFLKEHGSSVEIQEGYGLTECVTASCLTPYNGYREGSIGLPLADTTYAIVRPGTDCLCPAGEEGEIIINGPTVMLGYLKNEKETTETLKKLPGDDRIWLFTGDLGHMDRDGYVYFRQRLKRMIVTNGYNVYPGQIENVIDGCPEVAYSCVIGVADQRRGQRVKAYIVLQDGQTGDDAMREKIMDRLRLNVARYALPREIEFRSSLPKTLVGKVHYRKLEEEAAGKELKAG